MTIRRIVTGSSSTGKSLFVSDTSAPRTTEFKHVPGFVTSLLWVTPPNALVPAGTDDPSVAARSMVPSQGGTNLMIVTFPPDAVMMSPDFDPVAADAEYMQLLPGLAEKFEKENPGKHTTDTIDYVVLIDGELHLELDGGATKKLAPRDVVIQNGTRHAWRNKSNKPATMLVVLIGAKRV